MNKIYTILTWMLCIVFLGCSDDDKDTATQLLKVVASEASFDCKGGTGTIRVEDRKSVV